MVTSAIAAPAAGDAGDLEILNYALTLEYLESDFYTMGLAKKPVSGRELELITEIADHESAHVTAVTALIKQLGGTPVAKPVIKYPDETFKDKAGFLKAASTFEEVGRRTKSSPSSSRSSPDFPTS
ncbi:ferritin-like domain-containing protein [Amycolatopsis sp. cmx-8-4]|uniref:ferritin-like domain-containing protein n=1 Tax=Amycolatopsis sp. cmx-8-4 TaxID=2790947 RepID=UPI00397D06F0